jgi:alpha-D-ribose 1-methylphosphonate 5-triphosphate synthase subunit PhnG
MSTIIQTLTVAVTLLIVGLTCLVIGVAGLMWKAGRDQRHAAKAAHAADALTISEHSQHKLTSPTAARRQ